MVQLVGEAGATRADTGDRPSHAGLTSRISGLGTATAKHWVSTDSMATEMARVWPELDSRIVSLARQSGNSGRYLSRPVEEFVNPLSLGRHGPTYREVAVNLACVAASRALAKAGRAPADVDALIVVSCTGFGLPGIDTLVVGPLGLRRDVVRMPFTHLGCAGGVVGLARGADWVRGEIGRCALIIAVELPSLTFRPSDRSMDNLLSALVFGDGAGAAVLEHRAPATSPAVGNATPRVALHIGRTAGHLLPEHGDALGYHLDDDGYRPVLSRRLPEIIAERIGGLVTPFLGDAPAADLDVVAAHPGGAAILDAVSRGLSLGTEQLSASWDTLRATGNTSSAAVFFVLETIGRDSHRAGERGLALAFGPGLTVELLELRWSD